MPVELGRPISRFLNSWGITGRDRVFGAQMADTIVGVSRVEDYEPWPTFFATVQLAAAGAFQYGRFSFLARGRPVRNLEVYWGAHGGQDGFTLRPWPSASIESSPTLFQGVIPANSVTCINGEAERTAAIHDGASNAQFGSGAVFGANNWPLQRILVFPSVWGRHNPNFGIVFEGSLTNQSLEIGLVWQEQP